MPFLYADVPSTMSLAIWSITFRQNRWLTLEDTPIGSDLESGRWVARIRYTPNAGPILMIQVASSPACLPYLS